MPEKATWGQLMLNAVIASLKYVKYSISLCVYS